MGLGHNAIGNHRLINQSGATRQTQTGETK